MRPLRRQETVGPIPRGRDAPSPDEGSADRLRLVPVIARKSTLFKVNSECAETRKSLTRIGRPWLGSAFDGRPWQISHAVWQRYPCRTKVISLSNKIASEAGVRFRYKHPSMTARACRPLGGPAALFFPWMKDREGNPFPQGSRLVVKGRASGAPNPGSTPLPISAEFPLRWQVPFLLTPNLEFEHSNLLPRDVGHGCLSMNSRNVTTVLAEPVFHHLQDVVGGHRSDPLQLDLAEPHVFPLV